MPSFNDFLLQPATRAVLAEMEITEPTPIQAEAIPALMAGHDLVGQSATGSGKTLAYGIPLVERLARNSRVVQALVLVPTRELAIQVHAVLAMLAASRRLSMALLVGGRPYGSQMGALRYGAQIVVGTPGRVKDHLDRGTLVLDDVRMCVLDEADQMLDSGFAPAIEEILATTPDTRQTALFSATIPDWVAKLQQKFLDNPVKVSITPADDVPNAIEQIAYQVPQEQKMAALCTLLRATQGESSLIFGRTKHGVEKLGKQLSKLGFTVGTLHGNKSQNAREAALSAFRMGQVQTLLATNVAARGLDITGIDQVINYELPESSELFTHRVGRTGRMGRPGKAITLLAPSEMPQWRRMTRGLEQPISLRKFALDEEGAVTRPNARPEAAETQEFERDSEQQQVRGRAHVSAEQAQKRQTPSKHEGQPAFGRNERRQERSTNGSAARRPAWQPEDFRQSERPYSGKAVNGRAAGAGRQPDYGKTTGKRKPRAFAATSPQRQTTRSKSAATPAAYSRRGAATKRFASR